jgi:hypothetical protein
MQGEIVVQYHQEPLLGHTMLWFYAGSLIRWYIRLCIIFWVCAGYAYRANAKRPADDPNKKDFYFAAIFLAPITWPLLLFAFVSLFIIKAVWYSIFLILLTIALVVVRKPFLLIWLDKIATKVGNILLEANTQLIKLFLSFLPKRSHLA